MWSIDLFPEYSIAMLKPGGRSYDFKKEFFYEMKKTDLKIIAQKKFF